MFQEEYEAAARAAEGKLKLFQGNLPGYFLLSVLAGAYIGFGVLLTNSIGAQLDGAPCTKLVQGLSFGVALSLVTMAGAELFTGNNLVMAAGMLAGRVRPGAAAKLWGVCWLGNLCGSVALAVAYVLTGLGSGAVGECMAAAALGKMNAGVVALLARGALCNMLVCLAVWCGFRAKSDAGKLIMVFWCLFAFVTTGFEHSVANMTLLAEALLNPCGQTIPFGGVLHNLIPVTLGNMCGGIVCVALPYYAAAKRQ